MPVPLTPKELGAQQVIAQKQALKEDAGFYQRGLTGDGLGNVVSSKPGYLKVRLPGLKNVTVDCYNSRGVPEVEDIPVVVGYDAVHPRLLKIIDYDLLDSVTEVDNTGKISPSSTTLHGSTHEWFGGDTTSVHLRQFTPLRVSIAAVGGFAITVERGLVPTRTGWQLFEQTDLDFATTHAGLATGFGVFVLVYLDQNGALQTRAGSAQLLELLSYRDIPYPPPFGGVALAGVRLYDGQTELEETVLTTDLVDLRFPQPNYYNELQNLIAQLERLVDMELTLHALRG